MFSVKSFVAALAVLAVAPVASAITVTGPSSEKYWVFGSSNQITWTYSQGDPNPVTITVTNQNTEFLNGNFSIAQFVSVSQESFTVTNVTLRPATGYVVNFINSQNSSILASSSPFEVKPAGTPPYGSVVFTTVVQSVSGTVTQNYTVTSTSMSMQATSSVSGSAAAAAASSATTTAPPGPATATVHRNPPKNGALSLKDVGAVASALAAALVGGALML
ncbi:hypothetical protein FRB99_008292 [Tulasnella sp. 403]|nr:hypothetical protein FRB99_008292 [Tulasnella sp. 403]